MQEAGISEGKKGQELVSLLEDEPFRMVSQLGLLGDGTVDYEAVKTCLSKQFAPVGLELEWQTQIHGDSQRASETILEFAGRLHSLADKAYPSWSSERRLEVARNRFIQGILSESHSIQLKLLTEEPGSLVEAVTLACRLQAVEQAQKQFKTVMNASAAHVPDRDNCEEPGNSCAVAPFSSIEKLSSQVEQLTKTVAELTTRSKEHKKKANEMLDLQTSWSSSTRLPAAESSTEEGCNAVGYTSAVACTLMVNGFVEGHPISTLVDTGSSVTLLHKEVWDNVLCRQNGLVPSTVPIMAVNGEHLAVSGEADVLLQVGQHH